MKGMRDPSCVFCRISAGEIDSYRIHEDDRVVVFLDSGPIFPGHCLVCPRDHYELFTEAPADVLQPVMSTAQLVGKAMERGLGADGAFIAVNNRVSQSVPHLHVHVIPRRKGDGMKGFFWPRRPYRDREHAVETQNALRSALRYLLASV